VALLSVLVAVTVVEETEFATLAVYEVVPDAKDEESVIDERDSAERVETFELITIEKDEVVATVVFASVIRAVMAYVPVAVGVPEITPDEVLSVIPAGSDPEAMEKVPEPDPPLVERVSEYALPSDPLNPADGVVIATAGIAYRRTTIPEPPFPALSLPEFVKPPAPPPPVFALPLLVAENG
jgi:hypothetical protein